MSLTDIQRDCAEKAEMKGRQWKSHLLAALRGHLSEQGGEETGVLEKDAAHDA